MGRPDGCGDPPGGRECSTTRSADRSHGCCPRRCLPRRGSSLSHGARLGPTAPRSAALLWGSWLVVTGASVQPQSGDHPPLLHRCARARDRRGSPALVRAFLWRRRHVAASRAVLAGAMGATAVCAFELLQRTPDWQPWLAPFILVGSAGDRYRAPRATVVGRHCGSRDRSVGHRHRARRFGQLRVRDCDDGPFRRHPVCRSASRPWASAVLPFQVRSARSGGGAGAAFGGVGSLTDRERADGGAYRGVEADAGSYTWVAATIGSNSASGYQLATGDPVMSIGGFNGTDPAPTLAQFQSVRRAGQIHYYIGTAEAGLRCRGFGGGGTGSTSSQIESWVTATSGEDGRRDHDLRPVT